MRRVWARIGRGGLGGGIESFDIPVEGRGRLCRVCKRNRACWKKVLTGFES